MNGADKQPIVGTSFTTDSDLVFQTATRSRELPKPFIDGLPLFHVASMPPFLDVPAPTDSNRRIGMKLRLISISTWNTRLLVTCMIWISIGFQSPRFRNERSPGQASRSRSNSNYFLRLVSNGSRRFSRGTQKQGRSACTGRNCSLLPFADWPTPAIS